MTCSIAFHLSICVCVKKKFINMCSIHYGISTQIWKLTDNKAALAKLLAISFACLRTNSTCEFSMLSLLTNHT